MSEEYVFGVPRIKSNSVSVYSLKKMAEEYGAPLEEILEKRRKYVLSVMATIDDYIDGVINEIPALTADECIKELLDISKAKRGMHLPQQKNEVTQDMIDQARGVRITSLVEFIKGRAKCFEHEDKTPSAYYSTRVNRLTCPVCNKSWDSIDVKMMRDGLTFLEAVRSLCAGNY